MTYLPLDSKLFAIDETRTTRYATATMVENQESRTWAIGWSDIDIRYVAIESQVSHFQTAA